MAKRYDNGNIKWGGIPRKWISPEDANALLDKLDVRYNAESDLFYAPTSIGDYQNKVWFKATKNIVDIFVIDKKETFDAKGRPSGVKYEPSRYFVRINAPRTQTQTSGAEVRKYMEYEFSSMYGLTFKEAFGYSTIAANCIPKPLNETTRDGRVSPEIQYPFFKIDASSAYGNEASKTLPTMNGSRVVDGYMEPTTEFPFVFYIEEGKMAILNEFNTNTAATAKKSLMCPASPYTLAPIFLQLYVRKEQAKSKEEKQYYKDIMNFFVGMWHYRPKDKDGNLIEPGQPGYDPTCPRYAILAAVVKERCNQRMLRLRDEIEEVPGNEVWLINTDAVGWVGKDMPHLYTTEKQLGNLLLEHKNAEAIILGSKKYQIRDENGTETKWAGVPLEKTEKMGFREIITSPERTELIEFDTTTSRFTIKPI